MHPELADKYRNLTEYADQIIARLKNIDPEILQHKPDPMTWSPIQVLDHLVLAERLSNGYIHKKYNAIESLPDVGLKQKLAVKAMAIAQKSPKGYQAPKYVSQPNGDQTLDEVAASWKEEQKVLADFLDSYPGKYLKRALYKHPFIGRLSLAQMMDVHLMHIKRHEKQIDGRIQNFQKK